MGRYRRGGPGDPESSQDASIFDTDGDSASEKPDSGCEEGGTVFIGLPEFQPVVYSDCVDGELRPVYGRKRSRGDGAVWRAIAGTPGKLAKLKHFRLLKEEICGAAGVYGYDPSKLVLFPDFMTGTRLAEVLRTEYHLEAEMSSGRYVLLMTSFMDTEEGFSRLERALLELDARVESWRRKCWLKDAKQGRQEPFSGAQLNQKPNQENDSENYPQQMCLPGRHGMGMACWCRLRRRKEGRRGPALPFIRRGCRC